jgi:hypothetical protein
MPTMGDAYEYKAFCQKLTSMGALGTLDKEDKTCWFNPCKTRKVGAQPLRVRMEGERQRFVDAGQRITLDKGKYRHSKAVVMDDQDALQQKREAQEKNEK